MGKQLKFDFIQEMEMISIPVVEYERLLEIEFRMKGLEK